MSVVRTARLALEPITLALVEAVFRGNREEVEVLAKASVPASWPGRALVERAFSASLEKIRQDPETRLWGDRLVVIEDGGKRLLVGSVVFHGRPGDDGVAEVGYGVEESWQNKGFASESTRACVEWALAQPECSAVTATTPPWHTASIRVLERAGLRNEGAEEHEALGEVLRFTRRR